MAKAVTVTLVGGPRDGEEVEVPASWDAYRPPKAQGAYKPARKGATRWTWTPDPELK